MIPSFKTFINSIMVFLIIINPFIVLAENSVKLDFNTLQKNPLIGDWQLLSFCSGDYTEYCKDAKIRWKFTDNMKLVETQNGKQINKIKYKIEGSSVILYREETEVLTISQQGEQVSLTGKINWLGNNIDITYILFRSIGELEITSEPEGASVSFNNKLLKNSTPLTITNIPYGKYKLKLEKYIPSPWNGKVSVDKTVKIHSPKTPLNIDFSNFTPFSYLDIDVHPVDSQIYLHGSYDRVFNGKTLINNIPLREGEYQIELKKQGYQTFTEQLRVRPSHNIKIIGSLDFDIPPKPKTISHNDYFDQNFSRLPTSEVAVPGRLFGGLMGVAGTVIGGIGISKNPSDTTSSGKMLAYYSFITLTVCFAGVFVMSILDNQSFSSWNIMKPIPENIEKNRLERLRLEAEYDRYLKRIEQQYKKETDHLIKENEKREIHIDMESQKE